MQSTANRVAREGPNSGEPILTKLADPLTGLSPKRRAPRHGRRGQRGAPLDYWQRGVWRDGVSVSCGCSHDGSEAGHCADAKAALPPEDGQRRSFFTERRAPRVGQ